MMKGLCTNCKRREKCKRLCAKALKYVNEEYRETRELPVGKVKYLNYEEIWPEPTSKSESKLVYEMHFLDGMKVEDIEALKQKGYDAWSVLNNDAELKAVVQSFVDGSFSSNIEEFRVVYDELMFRNDEYYLLEDFRAYVEAQQEVERRYSDKEYWARMCLVNIAQSGFFSSDRTIQEYADEIWKIRPISD